MRQSHHLLDLFYLNDLKTMVRSIKLFLWFSNFLADVVGILLMRELNVLKNILLHSIHFFPSQMIPLKSKWRQTTKKMKMATSVKILFYQTLSTLHCTGMHMRQFTKPALDFSSWLWNGQKTCQVLLVLHFEIKLFCWKNHGLLYFYWTLYNGVCLWNLQFARSSQYQNIVPTIMDHLKTNRIM